MRGFSDENKGRRRNKMVRKCVIFHCLMFMLLYPAYSDDMDEATLEAILKKRDTTLILYSISFDTFTRIPVTKERMRESAHDCKFVIKGVSIDRMKELIFAARSLPKNQKYEDIRLLIDVISDDAIVYSVGISLGNYLDIQILEAFRELLGLRYVEVSHKKR